MRRPPWPRLWLPLLAWIALLPLSSAGWIHRSEEGVPSGLPEMLRARDAFFSSRYPVQVKGTALVKFSLFAYYSHPPAIVDGNTAEEGEAPIAPVCDTYHLVDDYLEPYTHVRHVIYENKATAHFIVAFRGTVFSDWKNQMRVNFRAYKEKCRLGPRNRPNAPRCGRIHAGLQRAYLMIRLRILRVVRNAQKITFTGHSLGGALAALATFDFHTHHLKVANCYTYGTPQFADPWFEMENSHLKGLDQHRITQAHGSLLDPISHLRLAEILGYSQPYRHLKWLPFQDDGKVSSFHLHSLLNYKTAIDRAYERSPKLNGKCLPLG